MDNVSKSLRATDHLSSRRFCILREWMYVHQLIRKPISQHWLAHAVYSLCLRNEACRTMWTAASFGTSNAPRQTCCPARYGSSALDPRSQRPSPLSVNGGGTLVPKKAMGELRDKYLLRAAGHVVW